VDEFTVVNRAREFVSKVNPKAIPVSVEAYVTHIGGILRRQYDLDPDEPGWSFQNGGKHYVCVNGNDQDERQRFTVCHELAHIVLGLASEHSHGKWWSYSKRPPNEIACDVFAAELLLPYGLFKPQAEKTEIGLRPIFELARDFGASRPATGSRFAAVVGAACAFVLSERGKVRYASRSRSLRDSGAWIPAGTDLPAGSSSYAARAGEIRSTPEEIDAADWFKDWDRPGMLLEEARHVAAWDQTLTLLWFEDEENIPDRSPNRDQIEDKGLRELDGILPWPGRKRRR
jgi:hypothetical protein